MRSFRRFAFFSTLFTYLVIFTGGLVRVTGAGLGCPDWPHCFGRWLPPLSYSQIPPEFDVSQVNLVLAWIEYLNRVMGMILGILVAVTAVLAIIHYRKQLKILIPSIFAGLLVAFLGWQGGQVVQSELEPLVVSMHLFISLLLLSVLTYVSMQSYYLENPEADRGGTYPKGAAGLVGALWIAVIVQVVLGAHVRSGLEMLAQQYPLATDMELIGKLGIIKWIHPLLGGAIALFTWIVGLRLLASGHAVGIVKQGVWWIMLLVAAQLILGLGLLSIGTPPLLQVFHLWLAALLVGALLSIYVALKRETAVAS